MDKPKTRILSINPLKRYIADPGAMGLFAFAVVTFLSGTSHAGWRTTIATGQTPAMLAYGGLVQVIAGLLDFLRGEKISGSTFVAFGFFWVSNSIANWPVLHMATVSDYPNEREYGSTQGWYLIGWTFVAFSTTLAMLRTTICQVVLLSLVTFCFCGLAFDEFYDNEVWTKFIGYALIVTGLLAWYVGTAFLLKDKTGITLPLGHLPHSDDEDDPFHMAAHVGQDQDVLRSTTVTNYLEVSREAAELLREKSLSPAVSGVVVPSRSTGSGIGEAGLGLVPPPPQQRPQLDQSV